MSQNEREQPTNMSDQDCASLLSELNEIVGKLKNQANNVQNTVNECKTTNDCLEEIKKIVNEILTDARKL